MSAPRYNNNAFLLRATIACMVIGLCMFACPCPAFADPSTEELAQQREGLENELAEAQGHLDQLRRQTDEALQRLESSREELAETRREADETRARVDEASQQLEEGRATLGENMRESYKTGNANLLSILLGADSFEELVNRIYYLDRVSEARAEEIRKVNALAEEFAARQQELAETEARLQEEVEAAEAMTAEYEEMMYAAQDYRDGLSEDVQLILDQEDAARAAEEERRRAEEAAGEGEATASEGEAAGEGASSAGGEVTDAQGAQGGSQGVASGPTTSSAQASISGDADRLVYILWGSLQQRCWPMQGVSTTRKFDCGCMALIHATILLSGDYSITPDGLVAQIEAKYGSFSSGQAYNYLMRYVEEMYGIRHRNVGHLSAAEARGILAAGHMISAGGGCEGRDGMPFCKEPGVLPRCCHGHVVLFYKYENDTFWAKDSSPADGAAMCAYPEGPLTVTHRGAAGGRCDHNGETVTYANYADAFLTNCWNMELWVD